MVVYNKFCKCGRLLTLEQMRENKDCEKCQKQHAAEFHRKYDLTKEEK